MVGEEASVRRKVGRARPVAYYLLRMKKVGDSDGDRCNLNPFLSMAILILKDELSRRFVESSDKMSQDDDAR